MAAPSRIALFESADNLGPSVASQLFDLIVAQPLDVSLREGLNPVPIGFLLSSLEFGLDGKWAWRRGSFRLSGAYLGFGYYSLIGPRQRCFQFRWLGLLGSLPRRNCDRRDFGLCRGT